MSCRELERMFVADAPAKETLAHRASCLSCDALARELDAAFGILGDLKPAPFSSALREAIVAIPRYTVSCEGADRATAAALEGEVSSEDRARLDSHLSRCEACAESAAALTATRELAPPVPAPWLFARVALSRPRKENSAWRWILNPRAAVAFAYAAAVVVMLAGFNPADLARRAGAGIEENARTAAASAGSSLADRFGALQEKALRKLAVLKGRASGYSRAALSNAIALVMKTETRRPPNRPKEDKENGVLKQNETQMITWRA